MMEKRNFVTSARTPMDGAKDIDDILDAGAASFGKAKKAACAAFEKKASAEDEKSDRV